MKIRTIIVDDVDLARERVKMLLADHDIEIIAECDSGADAVEAIRNLKPDLVFLDVQMPEMNGFEVVEAIGVENIPAIVFVTAYDKFAVRAFEMNAIDYLVKPFDKERLGKAVERVKREIARNVPDDFRERLDILLKAITPQPKFLKRIFVKSVKGSILLPVEDIDRINAAGHYVELHTKTGEAHLIRGKMTTLEEKLDPEQFVRIHRSSIVNLNSIKSLHPLFSGDHLIILRDGTELNMSRTYYEKNISLLTDY